MVRNHLHKFKFIYLFAHYTPIDISTQHSLSAECHLLYRLKGLEEKKYIDYNYLYELVALTAHLIETVSKNNPMVMKVVELMGGGKVIDTGSDRIYHEGLSAGISQGISQGISHGISESIMSFLEEYGTIPDDLKARIHNEHDIDTLKKWNKLSARVSSVDEFIERIN